MYYVLLAQRAIGPFANRNAAYAYAGIRMQLGAMDYAVKSDRIMQTVYLHLPITKP